MVRFIADTTVMVAAVLTWHEHHAQARTELEQRLGGGDTRVVTGHSVAEPHAVFTRLPPPHRLSAADAARLIVANFVERAEVVVLDASGYRTLLQRASSLGVAGGQTYDLVIAECGRQAAVQLLVTLNDQLFRRLTDVDIVVPRAT